MKRPVPSLLAIISFATAQMAAASEIVVNPDKSLTVDGKKTFPTYAYGVAGDIYLPVDLVPVQGVFLFDPDEWKAYWGPSEGWEKRRPLFEATSPKVYWCVGTMSCENTGTANSVCKNRPQSNHPLSTAQKNSPNFFGYFQIDEPLGTAKYETLTALTSAYEAIHADDPDHPVIVNFDPYHPDHAGMWEFQNTGDVLSFEVLPDPACDDIG